MATQISDTEITNYLLIVIAAALIIAIQLISITIKSLPKIYKVLKSIARTVNTITSSFKTQDTNSRTKNSVRYWNIEITLTSAGLSQRETIFQALRKEQVPILARDPNLIVLGSFDEKLHAFEIARKLSNDYGIRSWLTPANDI